MSAQNLSNPNTTQFTASTAPGSDGGDAFPQLNPANSNPSELPTPAPSSTTLPISPSSDTHKPSKIHARNNSVSLIDQSVDDTPRLKTPPRSSASSQLSQASMSPVSPNNSTTQRARVTPAASASLEHSRLPYDEESDTEWSP